MQLLPVGSIADNVYYIYYPHHGLNHVSEVTDQLVDLVPWRLQRNPSSTSCRSDGSELGVSQGCGSPMTNAMGTHIPDPPWLFLRKQGVCDLQAFKTRDCCKTYGKHRWKENFSYLRCQMIVWSYML